MAPGLLVWISAKNRETAELETIGLWTGEDHLEFSIGGETRTYYGAGTLLRTNPLDSVVGLSVRSQTLTFSSIAPEVQQALRGYDPRLAPAEMHVAYFDKMTGNLLAEPMRVFKGLVNTVEIITPAVGGTAEASVELLSASYRLTKSLAVKKSEQSLLARSPTDKFRQYTSVAGSIETIWGGLKAAAPESGSSSSSSSDESTSEEALRRLGISR